MTEGGKRKVVDRGMRRKRKRRREQSRAEEESNKGEISLMERTRQKNSALQLNANEIHRSRRSCAIHLITLATTKVVKVSVSCLSSTYLCVCSSTGKPLQASV